MKLLASTIFAVALLGCGARAPRPQPPALTHGEWVTSATEPYKGKQDDIFFVSPTVGFYGNGAGKIFRTNDAGATWTKVLEQPGTYIRALGFIDAQHGFAGNIGPDSFPGVTDETMLYRTDDGGGSWKPVVLPDADGARGVCAIDILRTDAVNAGHPLHKDLVHVGGRVNGPASLFASDDGGASWKRLPLPPQLAMILDVKFVDSSVGFVFAGTDPDAAKSHGLILKTLDSGRTWKTVYESARPYELMWKGSCPSRTTCYATLQNYSGQVADDPALASSVSPQRYVVKSEDGGATWRELPLVNDLSVMEFGIAFVDDQHGWVGAAPNGFETVDGGAHWTAVPSMPLAANKLRIVRDGSGVHLWAIGLDVRHLELHPADNAK